MIKKIGKDVYEFDKKNHKHFLNGEPLVGVTTCLKVINPVSFDEDGKISSKTDMLMSWAVKQDIEGFAKRAEEYVQADSKTKHEIIKQCKSLHRKEFKNAGDYGTVVHETLENILNGNKIDVRNDIQASIDYAMNFLNEYHIARVESHVWSKTFKFGGIFDLLLEKNGKMYIADFKTSKGVYDEYFTQLAAYHIAIDELALQKLPIAGYIIIHLPKSQNFSIVTNKDRGVNMKESKQLFLAALAVYRLSKKIATKTRRKKSKYQTKL